MFPFLFLERFFRCALLAAPCAWGFHGCVQPGELLGRRAPPGMPVGNVGHDTCYGGVCVGMHGGPHEGGPASYPVGTRETGYTAVSSTMTVPLPPRRRDGICYYIWTDIFFGDQSQGRMNQFVPQLILGNALDRSSGPPLYRPGWGYHDTWQFGAHYFFELFNETSGKVEAHALYGELFEARPGETLFTTFRPDPNGPYGLTWTLEMSVLGDMSRLSRVQVDQPYAGLGASWEVPTRSWAELNYTNMCVNSCWELYGARDRDHLPASGSHFDIKIQRPETAVGSFDWVERWDEDEGQGKACPSSTISERHNDTEQHVEWDVFLPLDGGTMKIFAL